MEKNQSKIHGKYKAYAIKHYGATTHFRIRPKPGLVNRLLCGFNNLTGYVELDTDYFHLYKVNGSILRIPTGMFAIPQSMADVITNYEELITAYRSNTLEKLFGRTNEEMEKTAVQEKKEYKTTDDRYAEPANTFGAVPVTLPEYQHSCEEDSSVSHVSADKSACASSSANNDDSNTCGRCND